MCQNSFTGRTVENVVEIIILFVFFPTISSKYVISYRKRLSFYRFLTFYALWTLIFKKLEIGKFVFFMTVGSSLY